MSAVNNNTGIDINDVSKYKATNKKRYKCYLCRPPIGTRVNNFLENSDYITTKERQFVISGTMGERWVIDFNKLSSTYVFAASQEYINNNSLNRLAKKNSVGDYELEWIQIETKTDVNRMFAMFIPKRYIFRIKTSWGDVCEVNRPSQGHGKGDFIVCPSINGVPDLNDRWVVNGRVFARTYNLKAFSENVDVRDIRYTLVKPKSLIDNCDKGDKYYTSAKEYAKKYGIPLNREVVRISRGIDTFISRGRKYDIAKTRLDNLMFTDNENGEFIFRIDFESVVNKRYVCFIEISYDKNYNKRDALLCCDDMSSVGDSLFEEYNVNISCIWENSFNLWHNWLKKIGLKG